MVSITMDAMPLEPFILIQAATGAGKTIFFCTLIQRLLKRWPSLRIAVLAHRGILVKQAKEKMLSVLPDCPIGIASASVAKKVDVDSNVTIGTIQTLVGRIETTEPFDMIIIDEVHRLGPKNIASQYQEFLRTMFLYNQNTRVLGVTATPFRLGHGYIYGPVKKPEHENWFPALNYRIGINDLQKQGYLCEFRAKEISDISSDLKRIKVSGDYNVKELSEEMSKEIHIGSAVKAYQTYAEDRKHIVVFCVTIEHAEVVVKAFKKEGFNAASIHSKLSNFQRELILKHFEQGSIKILVNVMVLSEGWDCPATDCIIMCRPTKSAALYVQMVGRGLRPHPGKKDVLILDLSGNCREHGDPDNPIVPIPGRTVNSLAVQKTCPSCRAIIPGACQTCPECGYQFPQEVYEQNGSVEMTDVSWIKKLPEPFVVNIGDYSVSDYTSNSGNRMLKLTLNTDGLAPLQINEFFMFDRDMHPFARQRSRKSWLKLVGTDPPESTDEVMERIGELEMSIPGQIEVIEDGRWMKVHSWQIKPWNMKNV
ncbi:MAG: DEAD/DEAH box helicase [Proteobacteria bacterium]|nr:DEAD/DEAH box helicase [Pseudomonadota bacterium]